MNAAAPHGSSELPEDAQAELVRLVRVHGENHVLAALGLNRQTLARAMAGLGLRRGTILQIELGLRELGEAP